MNKTDKKILRKSRNELLKISFIYFFAIFGLWGFLFLIGCN